MDMHGYGWCEVSRWMGTFCSMDMNENDMI